MTAQPTASPAADLPSDAPETVAGLRQGALTPRQALFFGLCGAGIPLVLAGTGGTMSFSSGYSSWLAMVIGATIALLLAAIVVRFSRRYLTAGSLMSYVTLSVGPRAGAVTGAALLLGYIAVTMLMLATCLVFLVSFLQGVGVDLTSVPLQVIVGLVILVGSVLLACRGVSVSVNTGIVMGWIALPFVIVILIAAVAVNGVNFSSQLSLEGFQLDLFVPGIVLAFGIFAGFEGFTALAQETENPRKSVPGLVIALVLTIAAAGLVGLFITIPIVMAPENSELILAGASPLSVLAAAGGLGGLGSVCDLLLFIGSVASILVFVNDAGRIVATAAKDGLLPASIGEVHPRYQTPARALAFIGVLAGSGFAIFLLLSADALYTVFVAFAAFLSYSWSVAYVMTGVAGVIDGIRTKTPWFTLGSLLGTLAVVAILIYSLVVSQSAEGTARVLPWVSLGIIALLCLAGLFNRNRVAAKAIPEKVSGIA